MPEVPKFAMPPLTVLAARRVRTALTCSLLLLLFGTLSIESSDFYERIPRLVHFNNNASATILRNGTTEGNDLEETSSKPSIRWSDFAYVQYVTNTKYLCNALMIFEALRRHNTKADLLKMYPHQWNEPSEVTADTPYESKLLAQARDEYKTNLVPIQVKTFVDGSDPTWQDSYTKLLAFKQTRYKRLMSLDSDATVLDVCMRLPSFMGLC
jgi:alpha-N-acetylglucosamine transferase